MDIVITLTAVQLKALSSVCADPTEYIQNFTYARCQAAIDDIVKKETERMLNDPTVTQIPASKDDIVMQFNNSGTTI